MRFNRGFIFSNRARALIAAIVIITCPPLQAQVEDLGPEELYQRSIQLFTSGKFAESIPYFSRLFELFGNEREYVKEMERALYGLASAYYNTGQYAGSSETFAEFVKRYPNSKLIEEVYFRSAAAQQQQSNFEEAITFYTKLVETWPRSPFAEDAGFQIAICNMAIEKAAEAVIAFESFVGKYPQSDLAAQAYVFLGRAYFQNGDLNGALNALEKAGNQTKSVDHLVYANGLAMEIGDEAFDQTDYALALRAFRRVRTSQSLEKFQQEQIDQAKAALEASMKMQVDIPELAAHFRRERRLRASLQTRQEALEKHRKTGNYDAPLFHRIGRCFFSIDRFWEARTAYARVVRESADPVLKENAHFDLILTLNRLRHFDELIAAANQYLEAYGKDRKLIDAARVPAVAFMRAESYVNMEQFEQAETEMAALERQFPQHKQMPRIRFYRALAIAMQERFPEAIALFQTWLRDHPEHSMKAEVAYWLPVSMFYGTQYQDAIPLFDQYVQQFPMSVYAPEAAYRSALSKYSLEQYEAAITELEAWLATYPDHVFRWEARVTLGDACAAEGRLEEAKDAYLAAIVPEAGPMEYLALTQINKVFKALETPADYRLMADTHIRYIQNNPNSPNMIESAYHAGWALRQIGRIDESRRLYWNCIERFGNNRQWEGFGPLLKDLRGMYRDMSASALEQEYEKLIEKARGEGRQTLVARLVRETLSWRDTPAVEQAREMERRFNSDVLDAELLSFMGDAFIRGGEAAKGQVLLDLLLTDFPASRFTDVAYARRAEGLLVQGDATNALANADMAIARANEPALMMEAVYTKARALQALGRHREAIEEFNNVLASRASPRALKPRAMLEAAACQEALGEWKLAIPYYQRIYVMYTAYVEEMAQAYLRSAIAFEKLKDRGAAINTYHEMLAVPGLAGRPELEEARANLARLEKGTT